MKSAMKGLITVFFLATLNAGASAQLRSSGPMPGEPAPDFTLNAQDGQSQVTLSELQGIPSVLIFASYT